MINITLEVSENIYNATLEILNTTINMTESNNTAHANISVTQNSTNGPVAFNITAYDGAGNQFNISQSIASANVIIDTVNPESSNLTIYSNNSRTDYAMAGHLLNITITANEALKNANITILNSTYVMDVNGTVANASVNVYSNSTEGEVLFNITTFDLAGNNQTVNQTNLTSSNLTIDHTNPTLSNLTIYSNNHNTSLATLGNTLNITITVDENLSIANITLLNSTYAMNITGMIANASVTVNASHADGQVEFNITAFDLAGHSLTVNQTNLTSSNLTIDKNIPTVSNLSLYSNNSNSSLAKAGDLINITLEVSENIYNATLEILNTTINMTESNNTAHANISVTQNSTNGPVAFNITAYDGAGNQFNISQSIASANVIIDTVNPESSNLTIYSNNSRTDYAMAGHLLNITITANEALKNANITILNSTYVMDVNGTVANASVNVYSNSTEGEVLFNITTFDLAGNNQTVNQTNLTSSNLTIDHTNPTLSNLTIYSNNHNTSLATLGNTLNITITVDENLSIANITLLNSTYAMNITGMIANASVTVNASHADGQVEFNITAFDLAGHSLTTNQAQLSSPNVTIDHSIPSVSNLSLYSNNSNSSLAKAGDLINITLEVSENIYNVTLEILNTTINMTESNNTAHANISVTQNSTNGPVAFNITAYDGAGNQFNISQSIASANVIIDTVNPESSNLTIYSNNSRTDYAMAGHLLNITITANEALKNANITILNSTYVMDVNGTVANASVNVYSNSTEGEVLFNITTFDLAGNNFTADQTELDSSNVIIDTSSPMLDNLTIYSNNANTSLATVNNILNIAITANETLKNANITILGSTYVMNVSGAVANASVNVDQNSVEGEVLFNITAFDLAGNNFTADQTELDSSNVIIDTSSPMLDNLTIYSNNSIPNYAMAGHLLNITITANETLKNANITILGSTYVMNVSGAVANASVNVDQNSVEGEVLFNITAFDLAGNNFTADQTELGSSNVIIDTSSPMLDNLTIYSNNSIPNYAMAGHLLNITITANETLKNANITILGSTYVMNVSGAVANASVNVDQNSVEGEVLFNITAFDLAGNNFTADQTELGSSNVIIDTSSPMLDNLTIYSNNTNTSLATVNNNLTITITANEDLKAANITILGFTNIMSVNDAVATASVNVYSNSTEGEVLFDITAYDLAGNSFAVDQTQLSSSNVIIDSSIPGVQSLNVTSDNSNPEFAMAGDTITVTLQVSEQIATSTIQILNNDITMSVDNDTASANVTVLQNSQNGPVEFNITAYDKTGNVFNVAQNVITGNNVVIDTNNPSLTDLTISSNNTNASLATVNNILNITITANEALKNANITILGSTYVMNVSGAVANANVAVDQNSAEGEVLFNITAFDLAGNNFTADQTQLNSSNVIIDSSIPDVQSLNVISDNSNPEFAMAGDTITVTLQVSEQIATSTIQILNNDITMSVDNDTASANVTVLQNSQNGPVEFNITAYDKTGNVFNVITECYYWKQCRDRYNQSIPEQT